MLHFDCDYMRGCHPEIMRRLAETNLEQHPGYGYDPYSDRARALILEACGLGDKASVSFLAGGTQTNAVVLDCLLGQWQGVICADTGHINVHEAGAIEACGHKVIALPSADGKLSAETVRSWVAEFYKDDTWPHMVQPGAVYISFPTELGTLYTLDELRALRRVCDEFDMVLYLDGARLLYGLAAETDVTLRDIASLTDAFYIGGTKCGTLFGEAVVLTGRRPVPAFFTRIKRHGALLAKGRVPGVQFMTLFEGDLWQRVGRTAVSTALQLRDGLRARGYETFVDSPTNQQFFTLPNDLIGKLREHATFENWGAPGPDHSRVRFVTDWATTPADIDLLLTHL